jgi:hypothetical protein
MVVARAVSHHQPTIERDDWLQIASSHFFHSKLFEMASSTTTTPSTLVLDPSTDCHQRSRWKMPPPPEPSTPPPLVIHRQFVPLIIRPGRIIYGYGDASLSGAGGFVPDIFWWRIPMGQPTSAADSISRWRTQAAALAHSDDSLPNVVELLRGLQIQESVQDLEELEELEYVD